LRGGGHAHSLYLRATEAIFELAQNRIDRHPIEQDCDKFLKRTLAMELVRLDQLETAFIVKALRTRTFRQVCSWSK
jgi:hypothetical protein